MPETSGAQHLAEREPGKSATTTNRPALQRMLSELADLRPDFVIFYDLSRSARDEFDAFWLLREITAHGGKLESTQERIDDSAEGMLQFAIMSGVNAFRSRNDGKKVKLGLERKHHDGGTIGPAPLGYNNVREEVDGRDVAAVALDPIRAPFVKLAFDLATTGQYTVASITEVLELSGLTSRATRARPSQPLARSTVHRLLTNDYYTGIVTRDGVKLRGRHDALVDDATFERVQANLASQRASGSRGRKHKHYLSGQLTCGRCGRHFGYGRHRGRHGGRYEYYSCLSRVTTSGPCGIRYARLPEVEEKLVCIHARPWLAPDEMALVREALNASMHEKATVSRTEADRHTRRLTELERQQEKLLQLYYREAVTVELMQQEQARIKNERGQAQRWQRVASAQVDDVMRELDVALGLLERSTLYDELPEHERRLLNLALFDDFLIEEADDELVVTEEREETYLVLRQFADEVMGQAGPAAKASRAANGRHTARNGRDGGPCPDANPNPLGRGQGSHKEQMAALLGRLSNPEIQDQLDRVYRDGWVGFGPAEPGEGPATAA